MKERYEIESIEQLRAIADLLRLRIIELLEKRAMTATQLGEELGLAAAKVHYHVRELERVGLLKLVETREKGGILEKYYQPVAHEIGVNKALLSVSHDDAQSTLRILFGQISDGYLQAFRQVANAPNSAADTNLGLFLSHLYMTADEQRQVFDQLDELLKPFVKRREIADEKEIMFTVLSYPTSAPLLETPPTKNQPADVAVGTLFYTRKDLLKARAEGKRLRLNVIGICHFANNIEASLAEEVIESFHIVGKLTASPKIKEVLKSKEGREG